MTTATQLKDTLRELTGLPLAKIAKALDMTEQNLGKHLRNAEKTGVLNKGLGLQLKEKYRIFFDEGVFSRPDQFQSNETFTYESETKDPKDRLPIYSITAKAGIPYLVNTLDDVHIIDYISMPGFRDCIGWIQVYGDSMSGFVEDGEFIALKPASFDGIFWGSAYYIIFNHGQNVTQEPLVKYIRPGANDDEVILRSHKFENYPDMKMKRSQILSIFTVRGISKVKHVR